jgi:hypothetical protein
MPFTIPAIIRFAGSGYCHVPVTVAGRELAL